MTDLGSFHNNLYANMEGPEPEVGMGATEIGWTDREAYTVIEVLSPKRIVIQRDRAIRVDQNGMSESQSYQFERNPLGRTFIVTKRKDGKWKIQHTQQIVLLGVRMEYYDYSF